MTPKPSSRKLFEKIVTSNFPDKKQKQKPKINLGAFVRASDIRSVSSMRKSTNASYKVYIITEVIHDTIPSYRINYLLER